MATQGDSLIRKTQKGLSVLAFETTKQSRILKKRMRIAALQKEVKADLRDLGSLVYNSILHDQPGILEEEEVKLLVEGVRVNRDEIEHLRDGIARMNRAHKHFETDHVGAVGPAGVPPGGTETKTTEPVVEPALDSAKESAPPTPSPSKAPAGAAAPEKQAPATGDEPKRTRKTAKIQPAANTATSKAGKPATKRKPAGRKEPATPKAPPAEPASEEAPGEIPEKKDNP